MTNPYENLIAALDKVTEQAKDPLRAFVLAAAAYHLDRPDDEATAFMVMARRYLSQPSLRGLRRLRDKAVRLGAAQPATLASPTPETEAEAPAQAEAAPEVPQDDGTKLNDRARSRKGGDTALAAAE